MYVTTSSALTTLLVHSTLTILNGRKPSYDQKPLYWARKLLRNQVTYTVKKKHIGSKEVCFVDPEMSQKAPHMLTQLVFFLIMLSISSSCILMPIFVLNHFEKGNGLERMFTLSEKDFSFSSLKSDNYPAVFDQPSGNTYTLVHLLFQKIFFISFSTLARQIPGSISD